MSSHHLTASRLTVAAALLAVLAGCSPGDAGRSPRTTGGSAPADSGQAAAPSAGSPLWVDPDSPAARQVRAYEAAGRTGDARALRRIAERPAAVWPSGGDPVPDVTRAVRGPRPTGAR